MTGPLVSVVLPTYNRAALLPRAVESVRAQTYPHWDLIVVDDGSTDRTHEVLSRLAACLGDRIQVIRQDNRGSSAARNAGVDAARGRFVAFLDSDDEYVPVKLARQIELFQRQPELGFAYSDYSYVELDGTRHESAFATIHRAARHVSYGTVAPGLRVCGEGLFDHLLRRYFISTIVGIVRRDILGRAVRFAEDQRYAEEWLFFLQVVRRCRAGFVDEPLAVHHHTPGSLARTDAHQNTLGYRDLLLAIGTTFEDLSPTQRRVVRSNLADTYRQLGYDDYKAGDSRGARSNFAKSFRHRPTLSALRSLGRSLVRSARNRLGTNPTDHDVRPDPWTAQPGSPLTRTLHVRTP